MIRVARVRGGTVPVVRKAGELPRPALLRRLVSQGWILPDVQGAEIERWLAGQLAASRQAGRALSRTASERLIGSITDFLRTRNMKKVSRATVEAAVQAVSLGRSTVPEAVRRLWGVAARENPDWREATDGLTDALSQTWQASGRAYVHALAQSRTMQQWMKEIGREGDLGIMNVTWGRPNPRQIPAFRRDALKLVEGLDDTVRRGVGRVIERGLREGRNPVDVSREVHGLPRFGLTEQQAVAVQNYRRELEEGQWGAARSRGLHDQRFRVEPTDPEAIDALVERYGERMAAYRARTIARTEMMRAANRGAKAVWEELEDKGVVRGGVRQFWVTAPENASGAGRAWNAPSITGPCPICAPIPAMNPDGRAMDEPFQYEDGEIEMPPVHPNCRCVIFYRPPFLSLKERMALPEEEW